MSRKSGPDKASAEQTVKDVPNPPAHDRVRPPSRSLDGDGPSAELRIYPDYANLEEISSDKPFFAGFTSDTVVWLGHAVTGTERRPWSR